MINLMRNVRLIRDDGFPLGYMLRIGLGENHINAHISCDFIIMKYMHT